MTPSAERATGSIFPFEERWLHQTLGSGPRPLRWLRARWRTRGLYHVPRPYRVAYRHTPGRTPYG